MREVSCVAIVDRDADDVVSAQHEAVGHAPSSR